MTTDVEAVPGERDFGRRHARVNPTVAALMRRGFDSDLANRLKRSGFSISALKQLNDADLISLGLASQNIIAIRKGGRSEIPFENLVQVLWSNRSTCCVCRDFGKAIIIHHIKPWSESRDHGVANLAVVCLEHHARAHRKGELEQNLGERQIREFKSRWENEVRHLDPKAILDATRVDGHDWWWFNHVRVLEMADNLDLSENTILNYNVRQVRKSLDESVSSMNRESATPYLYSGGEGLMLYREMQLVLELVLKHTTIFNVSDDLDRGILSRIVSPGDIILVQGKHYFKRLNRKRDSWTERGPGQICEVTREANGVVVTFAVDQWEAVSTSSWGVWLRGTQSASSILRVSSIERDGRKLYLRCTGLALGSALQGLSTRHYLCATWDQSKNNESEIFSDFDEPEL